MSKTTSPGMRSTSSSDAPEMVSSRMAQKDMAEMPCGFSTANQYFWAPLSVSSAHTYACDSQRFTRRSSGKGRTATRSGTGSNWSAYSIR